MHVHVQLGCSRTLETISIDGKDLFDLLRTTTGPKIHKIKITFDRVADFDTLAAMVAYYFEDCSF